MSDFHEGGKPDSARLRRWSKYCREDAGRLLARYPHDEQAASELLEQAAWLEAEADRREGE